MKTTKISGQLEIDHDRGVIYFHSGTLGITLLRICRLPTPIPKGSMIDIAYGHEIHPYNKTVTEEDII